MKPAELYGMYVEALESEGTTAAEWEDLTDRERIAWGKLARRLPREFAPSQGMLNAYPD